MKKLSILILSIISINCFAQNDFKSVNVFRDTIRTPNIIQKSIDTTTYKVDVVDALGNHYKMYWPTYGGSGSPGGSNTQVQYNNSSAFAGAANLTIVGGVPTLTNLNFGLQTVTTSGGTTTLTVSSVYETVFTGTSNHLLVLPDATTLVSGHRYRVTNNSTGNITVRNNGASDVSVIPGGVVEEITLLTNGTTNGTWKFVDFETGYGLSLTTTGTSGAATYNAATGELNIPNYSGGGGTTTNPLTSGIGLKYNSGTTFDGSAAKTISIKGWQEWTEATVQTTDATVTTLATYSCPNDGTGTMVIELVGTKTDNSKSIQGRKTVHWHSTAGAVTVDEIIDDNADYLRGFTTADWTIDASGGNLRIRVTGEASNTVDWSATYKLKYNSYAL